MNKKRSNYHEDGLVPSRGERGYGSDREKDGRRDSPGRNRRPGLPDRHPNMPNPE